MKLREKIKRFWTLDVHNHEGFTLVELIIVIAILAILSGVAVVGYSSYVTKANKQADLTLAAEVANALTLYYYDNLGVGNGYVILSIDGDATTDVNGIGASAMEAAFGSNWKSLRLKYNGWTADSVGNAYEGSTFQGNEGSLLQQVGNLTETMKTVLREHPELAGAQFDAFLQGLGLDRNNPDDAQAIANAAVLYVAEITQADTTNPDKVTAAFNTFYAARMGGSDPMLLLNLIDDLSVDAGLGNLGACAAIYAQAEAFCQYIEARNPNATLLEEFHQKTANLNATDDQGNASTDSAVANVAEVFEYVVAKAISTYGGSAYEYISNGQADKDSMAFLDAMGIVTENDDILMDRLDMEDCFTDGVVENIVVSMVGLKDGQIMILVNADGSITINPSAARGQ